MVSVKTNPGEVAIKVKRIRKRGPRPHYTCLFCKRLCSRYSILQSHICLHNGERPYPCLECDIWFTCYKYLWNHQRVVHKGIKWRCLPCDREFTRSSNLKNHQKRMHRDGHDNRNQCQNGEKMSMRVIAQKVVVKSSTARVSKVIVTKKIDEDQPNRPKNANKQVSPKEINGDSRRQSSSSSGDDIDDYITTSPSYKAPNVSVKKPLYEKRVWDPSFFLHMNRYVPDKDEEFSPDNPPNDKIDSAMNAVTKTPILHGSRMDARIDKVAENNAIRQAVRVEVTTKDEKSQSTPIEMDNSSSPFQCKKCGKVLANKYSFQNHQKIPNCVLSKQIRENPPPSLLYICTFCKKDFGGNRSNLVRHMASVHRYQGESLSGSGVEANTGEESKPGTRRKFEDYSCGFCGFKSDFKEDLQSHIKISHFELLGVPKD